jgi:hypothetical protein
MAQGNAIQEQSSGPSEVPNTDLALPRAAEAWEKVRTMVNDSIWLGVARAQDTAKQTAQATAVALGRVAESATQPLVPCSKVADDGIEAVDAFATTTSATAATVRSETMRKLDDAQRTADELAAKTAAATAAAQRRADELRSQTAAAVQESHVALQQTGASTQAFVTETSRTIRDLPSTASAAAENARLQAAQAAEKARQDAYALAEEKRLAAEAAIVAAQERTKQAVDDARQSTISWVDMKVAQFLERMLPPPPPPPPPQLAPDPYLDEYIAA